MTTLTTNDHKIKDLYIGYFNLASELFIERAYAYSERQAKMLMIRRIAKKKSIDPFSLFCRFNGKTDNFSVRKEYEFTEEN